MRINMGVKEIEMLASLMIKQQRYILTTNGANDLRLNKDIMEMLNDIILLQISYAVNYAVK